MMYCCVHHDCCVTTLLTVVYCKEDLCRAIACNSTVIVIQLLQSKPAMVIEGIGAGVKKQEHRVSVKHALPALRRTYCISSKKTGLHDVKCTAAEHDANQLLRVAHRSRSV